MTMSKSCVMKNILGVSTGAALLATTALVSSPAFAGGFINTSQSTVYNGSAYAGFTAGGGKSPSAMFLNPAIMTQFKSFTSENNLFGIMPSTKITGTSRLAATSTVLGTGPSGDIGQDAIAPASYFILPLGERFVVGLSVNAPFGLTTKPNDTFGGRFNSMTTSLRTYNFTPSVAYQVTDNFSIGAGIQVQYAKAKLWSVAPNPTFTQFGSAGIKGDGWGFGGVLGATWQLIKGTHLGIGWRTFIDQDVDGETWVSLTNTTRQSKGTLNLPNRVNVSLRQELGQFDLLASVEWQNWGRIGHAAVSNPATAGLAQLPFGYKDGWFFSLGGEYKATKELTLRTGIGYEISPVTDKVRSTRLPDNDRLWLSLGASYEITERFALNASYSHVFVKDANINIAAGNPNFNGAISYVGKSKAHVDILSIGLTSKWGDAPKKEAPLVRKF
jgi:long-chain fatty acid transport protein